MKTKTRLFLCLATLLILISLTSCSGLLASKNTASGKGRITIELGGARAATGPEVEGYLIYLVPTTKNRSNYENYMMGMMATSAGTMDIHNLPEGAILYTGSDSSKSYEVETGYWYILVTAFVDLGYEESVEFYGYATTLVSENQTSNVTLNMTQNLDFSENYAPNFEDTLYFIAIKDTYEDVDKEAWQEASDRNPLIFMPDISIIPDINFNPEDEEEEMVGLFLASMFAGDGSSYKLSNIQPRNNKLYADIIKVSYTDASDSTFLSNVQIKHVTEFGVQLEAGAADYFLFTSAGMEEYMVWFSLSAMVKYEKTQLSALSGVELSEEELAEALALLEPDPIEAFVILPEPESVSELEEQIDFFNNRNGLSHQINIIQ